MSKRSDIDRRDLLVKSAAAAGSASTLAGATLTSAHGQSSPLPPDLDPQGPLARYWRRAVSDVAEVDLAAAVPELAMEAVKERHQIYCFLLMALVRRFWNGNNSGPIGIYPRRENQKEP